MATVFGNMKFDSEVPSLPGTLTLDEHSSPQREVQSHSHIGDNIHLTPKVGMVDPAQGTLISVFQGETKVDPSTAKIREVLQSPLVQSLGATSQAQETKAKEKKKFDTLAIPPACPELENDGMSPIPLQRRDPEPTKVDPTVSNWITKFQCFDHCVKFHNTLNYSIEQYFNSSVCK